MKKIINSMLLLLLLSSTTLLYANNVQIANVTTNVNGGTTTINFDLSWENSWRGGPASNYDAVWVFIKYKDESGNWRHLEVTGNNNTAASGLSIEVPSDKKGVFIYRSADGFGNIPVSNITLGVQQKSGSYDIKVFGLEMVYVPQGPFYLGDFFQVPSNTLVVNGPYSNGARNLQSANVPFPINSTDVPAMGTAYGQLYDDQGNGYLDPNYPTGYKAFYCMKYELSQGGYRDFLNTISANHPDSFLIRRTDLTSDNYNIIGTPAFTNIPNNYRNGLKATGNASDFIGCDANGNNVFNEPDDGEWTACNYLGWADIAAFLDWAALRPMTEMEYEKAAKGPDFPTGSSYASGSFVDVAAESITGINTAAESVTVNNNSNIINYSGLGVGGPLRNGFAANATSNRLKSGGSYYGIMELSGNLEEITISTSNNLGRSFQGTLGDGQLTANGEAIQNSWPGAEGKGATDVAAIGPIVNIETDGISSIFLSNFVGTARRGGSFHNDKGYADVNSKPLSLDLLILYDKSIHNGYSFIGCRGVRQQ